MILKYAFRNLVRLPWRTLLYFFIVFLIGLSVTASVFVYRACISAVDALDREYIFVATLIPKDQNSLTVSEVMKCLDDTEVTAYNVTMSEGNMSIPMGESMKKAPDATKKGNRVDVFIEPAGCNISAVENLALVYSFFSGECTIQSGTGLTDDGYFGNAAEIVIPWWLADEYALSVGDIIMRRYEHNGKYVFMETRVVGIYKSVNPNIKREDYPAFIPLAIAERDLEKAFSGSSVTEGSIHIDRGDFVLSGRKAFDDFVSQAMQNGLDRKKSDIVFNNSIYDVISSELEHVRMLVLLVTGTVLLVGTAVFVFFTIYLYTSGAREKALLSALGMPKHQIIFMRLTEYAAIVLFAVGIGIFSGRFAASGVCRYVNDTVLRRASVSEELRLLESAADFDVTMPLERNMHMEIHPKKTRISAIDVKFNEVKTVNEGEIGISSHEFYAIGTTLEGRYDREWEPCRVVGITDMGCVPTSVPYDALQNLPNYNENFLYAYVSKNSPYSPDPEKGRTILFVTGDGKNSYVLLHNQQLGGESGLALRYLVIIGTYEENPYCSEGDILLSMEDYHTLYREMSVMESLSEKESPLQFERIHTVMPKEE